MQGLIISKYSNTVDAVIFGMSRQDVVEFAEDNFGYGEVTVDGYGEDYNWHDFYELSFEPVRYELAEIYETESYRNWEKHIAGTIRDFNDRTN